MKAEIQASGCLWITAETPTESYALKKWYAAQKEKATHMDEVQLGIVTPPQERFDKPKSDGEGA